MWSDHSLLHLNDMDTSSNASADRAEAFFNLQGSQIHSQGSKADVRDSFLKKRNIPSSSLLPKEPPQGFLMQSMVFMEGLTFPMTMG